MLDAIKGDQRRVKKKPDPMRSPVQSRRLKAGSPSRGEQLLHSKAATWEDSQPSCVTARNHYVGYRRGRQSELPHVRHAMIAIRLENLAGRRGRVSALAVVARLRLRRQIENPRRREAIGREVGEGERIAAKAAEAIDPWLRAEALDEIGDDVSADLPKGARGREAALAPQIDRVGDLRIAKPQSRRASALYAKVDALQGAALEDRALPRQRLKSSSSSQA